MIIIKAQAVCDGFNWSPCPDNATCDIELRLQETSDDVGDDRIPHLKTVVHKAPNDWLITGDYIVPEVVRCPVCIVKADEYRMLVDKKSGLGKK